MSEVAKDLNYTKSHEWVRLEEDGTVTVGISDHAQASLGDLVFVELPKVGQAVDIEEQCAVVESVKAASDIYSPVAGEIIEVNETLTDEPELVNNSPYDDGWLFKLKVNDKNNGLDKLLTAAQYEQLIAGEA